MRGAIRKIPEGAPGESGWRSSRAVMVRVAYNGDVFMPQRARTLGHRPSGWLTALVAVALGLLLARAAPAADQPTVDPRPAPEVPHQGRRILLLYGEPRLTPAIVAVDAAIRSTLESQLQAPVTFYTEYLDLNLFPGAAPEAELRTLLRRKYATRPLDLVLAAGSRVLRVTLQNRADLFWGAPVVFVAVDPAAAADIRMEADVTGTWLRQGWAETLDLARRLQPDTRQAIVITGSSPAERAWLAQARTQLAASAGSVEVRYLDGRAFGDILKETAALPKDAVVLAGPFLRDATGRDFASPDAIRQIAAASTVPVYGVTDNAVGAGVVGGYVVSFEAHGRAAAELALRVLAGERPAPADAGTTVPMFDARQLARWRLDEDRLPEGSVVLFQEPSAWTRYRWYIVGTVTVVLLQVALIGGLLVQRAQRRRAQRGLVELAGRLLTAQEEERRRIARDLHDDVSQELVALSMALNALGSRFPNGGAPELSREIAGLQARTAEAAEGIRQLSHALHPGVLEHVGLVAALRGYCREFEREHGLAVTFRADGALGAVPSDVALCLYRVTQEGLRNVVRHAGARHAQVAVRREEDEAVLIVGDDGCGFDLAEARGRRGLGLISLDERVRLVRGRLTIDTQRQRGTELRIVVPLSEAGDDSRDRARR